MKRKVYLSLLTMGLACMAVTLLISTWFFWNSTQHQIQQELVMAMDVVETTIEEGKDTSLYLKKLGVHETDGLRITWINTDGDVLFESDYDKGVMENHLGPAGSPSGHRERQGDGRPRFPDRIQGPLLLC